ncbi:hypothetical protein SVIOM342S_05215 [Streptomyces violaceorubidus]
MRVRSLHKTGPEKGPGHVVVVGAGIAGLAAATASWRAGPG